jgi:alkylhydroperoxidase family enzyme
VLVEEYMSEEEVIGLVYDPDSALIAPVDRAVVALARKIVGGAEDISDADIARLRDCGLNDEEIFDVIVTVAARCFFSKTLDATGTTPDAEFEKLPPPLRDALTVGRPIDLSDRP